MRKTLILAVTVTAALALGPVARAEAATPTEELRQYTDRVLKVLQDPALTPQARRAAVRDLAIEVFDVTETAKRALGPHWQQLTPAQREEFVRLFRDLLEQSYVSRIDEYGGERIRYASERVDGDSATVRAMIVTRQGTEVPVESRLLQKGDRWLIYDVLVENVSLVGNYRSQFDRIIRTASYDELVKRLKTQIQRLMEEKPKSRRAAEPVKQ
jgi:phospholipid transport system substrate-binding protein